MITFSTETAYAATELYRNRCAHDTEMQTHAHTGTARQRINALARGKQNPIRIECEIEANI